MRVKTRHMALIIIVGTIIAAGATIGVVYFCDWFGTAFH